YLAADVAFLRKVQLTVMSYRNVGACPTHINGDQVIESGKLSQPEAAKRSGRRPRQDCVNAVLPRGARRSQATVRLHDMQLGGYTDTRQALFQISKILADLGMHIAVHHSRAHSLKFPELRKNLARYRDPYARNVFLQPGAHGVFMFRVRV